MINDSGKVYHKQCTGPALETVKNHANDEQITLFAGCFCPFVQRTWVALQFLGIPYKVGCSADFHYSEYSFMPTN
jgi:glutathione S-transferase